MPSTFTKSNPESLTYENELLKLTALGGIKLDGLDRMRVTLKVELRKSSIPPVRHNLDLYNDNQLEKFARKISERMETAISVVHASLAELTEQLEIYRLEEIKNKQPEIPQPPVLGVDQRKKALAFLKAPNLMSRTNVMLGQSGIIGEETNRMLIYSIFTSRKSSQPLHVVCFGSSGTGKTHLQTAVGDVMPQEDVIEITTLSENAFYYFGRIELKNKIILIEDLDGAENVLYPLRELQSKRRISKTIAHKNAKGETKTVHLVVEGPVCVSGCTTKEYIYEDNANRSFLIYLDESEVQDAQIMEYQRRISAGKVDFDEQDKIKELLKNVQRMLRPIKIINPYAEKLNIPSEVFKPRRTNNHYLQFIEVVTYYHQYQREEKVDKETGELYIETSLEDIAEANKLLKEILLRKSDELTGACRNYLELIKRYILEREKKNKGEARTGFTNREIRRALRINPNNQKRYNLSLVANYYIRKVQGKKGQAYHYEIVSHEEFINLQNKITSVLDDNLKALNGKKTKKVLIPTS